jgi:hypothetical protein
MAISDTGDIDHEITAQLARWSDGDASAIRTFFPHIYHPLHALASRLCAGERITPAASPGYCMSSISSWRQVHLEDSPAGASSTPSPPARCVAHWSITVARDRRKGAVAICGDCPHDGVPHDGASRKSVGQKSVGKTRGGRKSAQQHRKDFVRPSAEMRFV